MTKSEIRAVSISKLDLRQNDILYDIGAGTGSVSVEAARYIPEGKVYAFEEKEEGCALIRENAKKFGVDNITVVPGKAPGTFNNLPAPDCAFIGGSGGNLETIVDTLKEKNNRVRIVVNAVTLETLTLALDCFYGRSLNPEVVCVSVSRAEPAGKYHLLKGQNPVYILSVNL